MNLRELGVFENLTLLKMWCEDTPRALFPSRKIGTLAEGYEASFLVLKENPLDNLEGLKTITRRFKQGAMLESRNKASDGTSDGT
jgi:imidazolonepropionase-like amidohydrolase